MKTYGENPAKKQMAFVKLMNASEPVSADVKGFRNDFYELAKTVKEMEGCVEEAFTLKPEMIEMMREAIMKVRFLKTMVEINEIENEEE